MQAILKEIGLSEFIAFDVETTGLNPESDAIIEFAAVRFVNGKPSETLSFLCDPGYPVPLEIEQLTGISTAMVQGQRAFEQHLTEVGDFFGDCALVGHNIGFDISFIKNYLKAMHLRRRFLSHNALYDTALLAQAFLFFLHNHRLSTIAEYYGLATKGAHRATSDALMTGKIFVELLQEVLKYDYETLQTINMILTGTDDPNYLLYQCAAQIVQTRPAAAEKFTFKEWNSPENVINSRMRKTGKKKSAPNDITGKQLINQYFSPDGFIAQQLSGFEVRPQQTAMAQLVWETLDNGNAAVIEAGTGVGKSLAYLVPAVLWVEQGETEHRRVVIASNTKTLQEQIFYKEIPFVAEKLGLPFKAVLQKGRANYICLTRWYRYLAELPNNLHLSSRSSIIPLVIWLKHTKTGDISENNGFKINSNRHIWNEICSEPGYCTTNVCQKYDGCFLGRIRAEAFTAEVVVVNHSLLLADFAAENKILPDFEALIVDEAHNLEKNAYNYFAGRINLPMLTYFLNSLFNTATPERGFCVDLEAFLKHHKIKIDIAPDKLLIGEKISDVRLTAELFFRKIGTSKWTKVSEKVRNYGIKQRYKYFDEEFPDCLNELHGFITELNNLKMLLLELKDKLDKIDKENADDFEELLLRLTNLILQLESYIFTVQIVGKGDDDEQIFWYEISPIGKELFVELVCTPLDISQSLHSKIWQKVESVILTSATLQIANSFDYIISRTGLNLIESERLVTKTLGSPFRYREQMVFYTFHEARQDIDEARTAAEIITNLARETGCGILVLFTSYNYLREVYNLCLPAFIEIGATLLAQGMGGSRSAILEQFRLEKNSVLFGTDSFWEGIDVIGEALEILIITKLPFPVPTEPILEANSEKIKSDGGDAFNEYYVPESVLKFRQGVGRLIRATTDIGVVVNLDNRIDTRAYGRYFKQSLPVEPISVFGVDELIRSVKHFFKTGRA